MTPRGVFVYTRDSTCQLDKENADIFTIDIRGGDVARAVWSDWRDCPARTSKNRALRRGVRGETFAYWYLRQHGYVFVARNFVPRSAKGEIDQLGYDGETLAFVEVRTWTAQGHHAALPEFSVTREKQQVVVRTAQRFLNERHVKEGPLRFDVVAIEEQPDRR